MLTATAPQTNQDHRFTVRAERRRGFVIRDQQGVEVGLTRSPGQGSYTADITTGLGRYRMQVSSKADRREDIRSKHFAWQWNVTGDNGGLRYRIITRRSRVEIEDAEGGRLWMRSPRPMRTSALGLYRNRDDRTACLGVAGKQGLPFLRCLVFCKHSTVIVGPELAAPADPMLLVAIMFLMTSDEARGMPVC